MRHLVLALFLAAAPAAAQARLDRPRPEPTDTTDAREPGRPRTAAEERELDRLRRRTGTPAQPAVPDRPLRGGVSLPSPGGIPVTVETDAPEYLVGETADDTDPIFLRITSAADGFLTLLSGGVGRSLAILAPNDLLAAFPVRAGEPVQFPLPEWIQQGIELRPSLPDELEVSQQSLIAVVTRRPVPLPLQDFNLEDWRNGDRQIAVRTFQTWLARLPVADRGLGQAVYVVRRR